MLRQGAPLVVVAVGATFVLVAAGIDLSIGAMVSFTGVVTALILQAGVVPEIAVPAMLLLAVAIGGLAGFLVAYQRLPSFIVTLGTLVDPRRHRAADRPGLLDPDRDRLLADRPRAGADRHRARAGDRRRSSSRRSGGCSSTARPMASAFAASARTRSRCAAPGAPVNLLVTSVYMLSAGLAAVGGLIIAMRLQAGTATAGTGLELKAIAAVVLGGTSLFGGKGTVVGSVLGVYTLAFIENGLVLNHVDPFYFNIIQGAILLAALWLNMGFFARMR